jgi:TolA-binding protein
MREMTRDRALVGVVATLVLVVLAVGCGLVSDQSRQEARKKVEAKGQQVKEEAKKKVEDLQKKVEAGQEDLEKKVDDVHAKLDDLQKKVDELLKKVEAQEQQNQKK